MYMSHTCHREGLSEGRDGTFSEIWKASEPWASKLLKVHFNILALFTKTNWACVFWWISNKISHLLKRLLFEVTPRGLELLAVVEISVTNQWPWIYCCKTPKLMALKRLTHMCFLPSGLSSLAGRETGSSRSSWPLDGARPMSGSRASSLGVA